ncbi:N-acetyltransferase [Atlantibacter hermannii]|uniref:N-acetyltransferase n=2 Tax=Atlantibacter hermannii TaxID=565 RepID=UPI000EBB3F94|nr:N-acetyltransferase [Atlantibacter hermannii]MCQ4967347.1 N-acetyltransferase [Enterobacteriaceae bacterium DFI.7.85]MDQ7882415.1 N-acetyltransferase [Atlantibacter hermannii]HCC09565.1 N-acetyltransferase [Atlantibacter hermannii]
MSGIVIRHAEPGDTEAVHRLFTQPEVYANTLQVPHPSRAMWQERMNQKSPGQYHLVAIVEDQVVGHLMIAAETRPRRSHVASFGLCVDAARHNQGIATALLREMIAMCDNWLRIERIELTVFVDNAPAIALYQKLGFDIEGTGKRYGLRDGDYIDAYFMARLRPSR